MGWLTNIERHLGEWLTSAETLRAASKGLRSILPIAVRGDRVFLSRYDDVRAVLADNAHFGVREVYADKMARTTGPFFLAMEDTDQYLREASIARRAVKKDDDAHIVEMVRDHAGELLDHARARGGVFDAVSEFSRLIPLRVVERYLGVPGPDPETMKQWMRVIFWEIFLNPNDDSAVSETAQTASLALRPYLMNLIGDRKKPPKSGVVSDDFVSRLVREQQVDSTIDDDLVLRNVGGVIVGAVDAQSKAIAHALDQLLRQPAALESARAAAFANDDELVRAHVWEALRFNPHNPALFRHCRSDTVVADGTERRTVIKKGSSVVALTISAMFDPDALDHPDEFRVDRPGSSYMHFGHGQHSCFGSHINEIVLPEVFKALLKLDNLAYAQAGTGRIEYDGPFPDRMMLQFEVPR
jgi:cytochrome P450